MKCQHRARPECISARRRGRQQSGGRWIASGSDRWVIGRVGSCSSGQKRSTAHPALSCPHRDGSAAAQPAWKGRIRSQVSQMPERVLPPSYRLETCPDRSYRLHPCSSTSSMLWSFFVTTSERGCFCNCSRNLPYRGYVLSPAAEMLHQQVGTCRPTRRQLQPCAEPCAEGQRLPSTNRHGVMHRVLET